MGLLIWAILAFIISFFVRWIQYGKEYKIKFVIGHSIFDTLIQLNPIGSILINIGVKGFPLEIYLSSIFLYIFLKYLYFRKSKKTIGILYPFIDLLLLFICISLQATVAYIIGGIMGYYN